MVKPPEKNKSKRALSFSDEGFDSDTYAHVANQARLLDVCLVKQNYEVKLTKFWEAEREDKLDYGFFGEPMGCALNSETGGLAGGYKWTAELKHGRSKVLKLVAGYMLFYGNLEGCDEDYAELYFNKIARFTSYPYFRAAFATSTSNSGVNLPPLPSLIDRVD